MNEHSVALFNFIDFLVTESHLSLQRADGYDFNLSFYPSGTVYTQKSEFVLQLKFEAKDAAEQADISLTTISVFCYENIPDIVNSKFLIQNAPAIVFPYLRAYVSTLTTQAGIPSIILPTLNLSGLGDVLRNNITVID